MKITPLLLSLFSITITLPLAAKSDPPTPPGGFQIQWKRDVLTTWSDGYKTYMNLAWPVVKNPPATGWPCLVLMHGKGGSRKTYYVKIEQDLMARSGYVVFAFDARGDGDTKKLNPGASFGSPARRLLDVAEGYYLAGKLMGSLLDKSRLAISGKSMGGNAALRTAAYSGRLLPKTGFVKSMPVISAAVPDIQVLNHLEDYFPGGVLAQTRMALRSFQTGGASSPMIKALLKGNYAAIRRFMEKDVVSYFTPLLKTSSVPLFLMFSWNDWYHNSNVNTDTFPLLKKGIPRRYFVTTGGHSTPVNSIESSLRFDYLRRWLDRFLKGVNTGVEKEPFVDLAVIPPNATDYSSSSSMWRHRMEYDWPPLFKKKRVYLRSGGKLKSDGPVAHELAHVIQQRKAAGYNLISFLRDGGKPARVAKSLPLVSGSFDAAPLSSGGELLGRPVAELLVEGSVDTFQVSASLWDVDSNGKAFWITMGANAVYKTTSGKHRLKIELGEVAYIIPPGHHLRLTIDNVALRRPPGIQYYLWLPEFSNYDVKIHTEPASMSWLDLPLLSLASASLIPRLSTASAKAGIKQNFLIDANAHRAGDAYILLISKTGIAPPVILPPRLDLVPDQWTTLGILGVNSVYFQGFSGILDKQGQAKALFAVPAGLPGLAGNRFFFATVGLTAKGIPFTTCPAQLNIKP